jgi:hypothetical protein
MPTKGNPVVTARFEPWMLEGLKYLSAHEVKRRAYDNEAGTGPRSLIQHAVRLYLISQAQDGYLPMDLIPEEERWRLRASDWKPLRDAVGQGGTCDCTKRPQQVTRTQPTEDALPGRSPLADSTVPSRPDQTLA